MKIEKMSMAEKLRLLNGKDFWTTAAAEKQGIRSVVFADGPTGLRYQPGDNDHLGLNESCKATCFPTSAALSCSWDPELVSEVASCIAREAVEKGVDVVLAPGVNIKRSPLCGRNFEYYSEDPCLTEALGIAFVRGLQKNGIGASLKHFAGNNQEAFRMSANSDMDDRTLYEIYLKAFEGIIRTAKPWTVMSAYNRLLGEYCSENKWLLTELLREQWEFDGLILSDWYAVNNPARSINSGMDLEMPSTGELSCRELMKAWESGKLEETAVNRAVGKIAQLAVRCDNPLKQQAGKADMEKHHEFARKAAAESIVLLKNDKKSLPLTAYDRLLLVGGLVEQPVFQGNGSSRVNPHRVDSIADELAKAGADFRFEPGYRMNEQEIDGELVIRAVDAARKADKIIVFAGLYNFTEAESYDRVHLKLPAGQDYLIGELAKLGRELIVVLQTGSAVEMPWIQKADSVLQMHLSGQGCGRAIVDVLLGKVNPGGKLTETYPLKLAHIPSGLHRGNSREIRYGESIFAGYRYYDKKELDVLFPFGHGLSYTEFEYRDLQILKEEGNVQISFLLRNKGNLEGSEIVQVYAGLNESVEIQPVRRLSAFRKLRLKPGETRVVSFTLPVSEFSYYDTDQKEFVYATGINRIDVGKSSRNIVLSGLVTIEECNRRYSRIHRNTTVGEILAIPALAGIVQQQINALLEQTGLSGEEAVNPKELEQAMFYMPLRNVVQITGGAFSYAELDGFIGLLNEVLGDAQN